MFHDHCCIHRLAEYARAILAGDVPYKMVMNEGGAPGKQHETAACVPTENLQAAKADSSRQGPQSEPADSKLQASIEPGQVQLQAELSQSVHCLTAMLCTQWALWHVTSSYAKRRSQGR